jgi:hypothetical protein
VLLLPPDKPGESLRTIVINRFNFCGQAQLLTSTPLQVDKDDLNAQKFIDNRRGTRRILLVAFRRMMQSLEQLQIAVIDSVMISRIGSHFPAKSQDHTPYRIDSIVNSRLRSRDDEAFSRSFLSHR